MNTVPVSTIENRFVKGLFFLSVLITFYISIRLFYTGSTSKLFLLWNILLAWIPVFALMGIQNALPKYINGILIFLWFIFFPNTLYLITDLKHINHALPLLEYWLDVMTLCLTACIGIILAVYALYLGNKKIKEVFSNKIAQLITGLLIVMSGLGVYLGRFPRLNSWHIFTEPKELWHTVNTTVNTLYDKPEHLFFVGLFSFTIGILYSIFVYVRK